MNCWEFNNCPENVKSKCPAYPDHGTSCWQYSCPCSHTDIAFRIIPMLHCQNCDFYIKYILTAQVELFLKGKKDPKSKRREKFERKKVKMKRRKK